MVKGLKPNMSFIVALNFEQETDDSPEPRRQVENDFIPPSEDCPLRDAASQKIPKLTVKVGITLKMTLYLGRTVL